ncbi:uncharacterized protein LOC107648309 [Arachis ipaensis]|uniref:uncharacterized protein LOC107648309 n=1 Tax=Arachis ipaensis TaxID=130454 RepID=UPI000A2B88D5|nr:uncharacterized protein LOC107648309 [Arachis ipaensis]
MHIYSQVLEKLAPHIQQVSMESNGKGVLIDGVPLPFEAGEVGSNHDDSIVDFIRGNMNSEEAAQIPRRTTRSLASSSTQNFASSLVKFFLFSISFWSLVLSYIIIS